MPRTLCALVCASLVLFAGDVSAGERLDSIKKKGFLTCGIGASVPGFSTRDARGVWRGFDVDICKAIAAAIFGEGDYVRFQTIDTLVTFASDSNIDVVLRGLTWTSGRETPGMLRFGPIILYDGQGFLVPKKANISNPEMLSGKSICVSTDANFLGGLRTYFRDRKFVLKAVVKEKRAEAETAFFAGECEAMTADASELAEAIIGKAPHPDDYVILPQQITKEPLAPLLRKGDDQFFDAVRWAFFALVNGEELGVTSANVEAMRKSENPDLKYFFAPAASGTQSLGMGWSAAIIKATGNYGEIFDRNLGKNSPAKLPRGLSRLWTEGGVLYAPPIH